MKLLADRSRLAFIPLDRYELDMDLARTAPREFCQRWCVLPFDRDEQNGAGRHLQPFQQTSRRWTWAARIKNRLLWYLASPPDLLRVLGKIFR